MCVFSNLFVHAQKPAMIKMGNGYFMDGSQYILCLLARLLVQTISELR
jgi:hypothetical protein